VEDVDIHHLARRAGFGATPALLKELRPLTRDKAVDRMLDVSLNPAATAPKGSTATSGTMWQQIRDIRLWWLERMRTAPRPLQEKLALVWHDHFATNWEISRYAVHTWELLQVLRTKGLGPFPALARAVTLSPAMLVYLDNDKSRVGAPNENLARESLELHLLGVGQYSEQDVVESARAWTGHSLKTVNGVDGRAYAFVPKNHDNGPKTIFGITKNWDGPQVIDECVAGSKRLVSAKFVIGKLWSAFAFPTPPPAALDALVDVYLRNGYRIAPTLRALFLRDEFWSQEARTGLLRSPVEYAVGVMIGAQSPAAECRPDRELEAMGLLPFNPPHPAGWGQNAVFATITSMLARSQFADRVGFKAEARGLLSDIAALPIPAAVQRVLDQMGLPTVSDHTRRELERHLAECRAGYRVSQVRNLVTMTALSAEAALA
jgi:uncharacterized protein (DUF1800 family)